uniref:Uncharacterized protein n=1 Tax=Erysiphe necator associated polymycovirus 5 TaxID=2742559 RepID=A0A8E3YY09_9VIRU|nr:hypothetical protein [Erysiphe necator associated polymycovirus 5]
MSDLTSLRHMILSSSTASMNLTSMVSVASCDPTMPPDVDFANVSHVRDWFVSSPGGLLGTGVAISEPHLGLFKTQLSNMGDPQLHDSVRMMRGTIVPNERLTRIARGDAARKLAHSARGVAQHGAQSAMEVAVYDLLGECGFDGVVGASKMLQSFMSSTGSTLVFNTRQFTCARVFGVLRAKQLYPTPHTCAYISPLMTSREAVIVYFCVLLRQTLIAQAEVGVKRRAATVLGYAARASLTGVRQIVERARGITESYRYDKRRMAFVNARDGIEFSITNRDPAVVVAFSRALSQGSCDVNTTVATLRSQMELPPTDLQAWEEAYLDPEIDIETVMIRASALLEAARDERAKHEGGDSLNKDPCLSYLARDKSSKARRTAECVNRIEEVCCLLRMRGTRLDDCLMVIEWAGCINHDLILAAAAMTGATIALDAGRGAFKIGAKPQRSYFPSTGDRDDDDGDWCEIEDDAMGAFVCLVPHAMDRGVPRMPVVSYQPEDGIDTRMTRLRMALGKSLSPLKLVYVSGGESGTDASDADVTATRCAVTDVLRMTCEPLFSTVEVKMPRLCRHGVEEGPGGDYNFMDRGECLSCANYGAAFSNINEHIHEDGFSLVKPRSSFAHNFTVALEFDSRKPEDCNERTQACLDSIVSTNLARNAKWPTYLPRTRVRRAGHQEFYDRVEEIVEAAYGSMMVDGELEDIGTVVDSVI